MAYDGTTTGTDAAAAPRPPAAPAGLAAARVAHEAGGRLVVDGITLAPRPGTTLGLLGPNGSGKSTLLRLLAGVLAPAAGVVTLDGTPLPRLGRRETARRLAVVDQHATTQVELTVREVVALGRIPHRRPWSGSTPADDRAVRDALDRTDLTDRADQSWHTLSGGERQRAHIARALAQAPRELLLDEPTNHLDIQHQLDLLNLIASLPVTTVVALHDLNLAAMFCDEILVLKEGRAYAHGTPAEVVTEGLIAEVYGVRARVTPPADPDDPLDHPSVRFLRTRPS